MWQNETVFHSGDLFFREMQASINQAKVSIDIEMYIFQMDFLGIRIFEALARAAKRGVNIRVLVDGIGTPSWMRLYYPKFIAHGIETKVYNPVPWDVFYFLRTRKIYLYKLTGFLWRLNRRNHRKVCIIDHRLAFVGSMNIVSYHLGEAVGNKAWRDTGAKVEVNPKNSHNEIEELTKAFNRAWKGRSAESRMRSRIKLFRSRLIRPSPKCLVRLNYSWIKRRVFYRDLVRKVLAAKKRVWFTTPYFVPEYSLVRALVFAAKFHKDVRIIVPRKAQFWALSWLRTVYYYRLLRAGVTIFEYLPTMIHAKIAIIDDWATIGSSNLNHRSLIYDLEVDIVLTKETSLKSLEDQFHIDTGACQEITLETWRQTSLILRLLGRVTYFFKRWL